MHFGSFLHASFIKKVLGAFFQFLVQKWSCLPWSSDAFQTFSPCKVYTKSCSRNSTVYAYKNEAVCRDVQAHFGSFLLARFTENVLRTFSRFLLPKQSCFVWSSDAFLTFSPCMLYIKCSGRIFTIYASKNEAVCCEVQAHFLSSFLASFNRKSSGCNSSNCASKNEAVVREVQTHFGSYLPASFTQKLLGANPRFMRPSVIPQASRQ